MEQVQKLPLDNLDNMDPGPTGSKVSVGMRSFISQRPKLMAISAFGANKNSDSELNTSEFYDKEKINQILQKEYRTEEDARILFKVLKNNAFFENFLEMDENLEAKAMLAICKQIKYEKFPANSVVMHQGAPSNGKMYIVYSGELNIHVSNPDLITGQNFAKNQKQQQEEEEQQSSSPRASETDGNSSPSNSTRRSSIRNPASNMKLNTFLTDKELKPEAVSTPSKLNPNLKGRAKRSTLAGAEITNNIPGTPLLKRKPTMTLPPAIQNPKILKGLSKLAIVSRVIASTNRKSSRADLDFSKYGIVVDTVSKGGFFGERALSEDKPRGATVVAMTHCELLVVTQDLFMSLKSRFDKKKNRILEFILQSIPTLDQLASKTIVEKLYYLFKEQRYEYGHNVITEDTKGDHVYLLFDGECEIVKNIKVDKTMTFQSSMTQISPLIGLGKTNSKQIMLYTIPKGTFFGDEVLFQKTHKYQYTVKVSSPRATIFTLQRSKFFLRFPSTAVLALKAIFFQKLESHDRRLSHVISTKFKGYNEITFNDEDPERSSPKNIMNGKPGRIIINNRGNNKEPTKVIVVTKEASPYYNVFKNARPQTSDMNLERFLTCPDESYERLYKIEEKGMVDPYTQMLMRNPAISSERDFYDIRGLEKVRRNSTANRKKKIHGDSFSKENMNENTLSIKTRCITDMEPFTANTFEGTFESPLVIKTVKSAMTRPNSSAFNEYFNEKAPKIPPLRIAEEEKTDKDLMLEHAKSIQSDLAKNEMDDRRFRLKRLQLQTRVSPEKPEKKPTKHKGDRILMIKASLEARKKKYEKKTEKLKNNFKDLIQMNFVGVDEKPPVIGASLSTIRNQSRATNYREEKSSQTYRPSTVFSELNIPSARKYQTTSSPFKIAASKNGDISRGSRIEFDEVDNEKKQVSLTNLSWNEKNTNKGSKGKYEESSKRFLKTISQFSSFSGQKVKIKRERGLY